MRQSAFRPPRRWRDLCCDLHDGQKWGSAGNLTGWCLAANAQISANAQIGFFAPEAEKLLHRDRAEHIIGVQFQRTAPERGLEDMAHMLARAVLAGLHQ